MDYDGIDEILSSLPKEIKQAYEHILLRVSLHDRPKVNRILGTLAFGHHAFTAGEMDCILKIKTESVDGPKVQQTRFIRSQNQPLNNSVAVS